MTTKKNEGVCVLCGNKIRGYGNNPYPLADEGECCSYCDQGYVIPARIAIHCGKEWEGMITDLKKSAYAEGCLVRLKKAMDACDDAPKGALKDLCESLKVDWRLICERAKD